MVVSGIFHSQYLKLNFFLYFKVKTHYSFQQYRWQEMESNYLCYVRHSFLLVISEYKRAFLSYYFFNTPLPCSFWLLIQLKELFKYSNNIIYNCKCNRLLDLPSLQRIEWLAINFLKKPLVRLCIGFQSCCKRQSPT